MSRKKIVTAIVVFILCICTGTASGITIGLLKSNSKPMDLSDAVSDVFCDVIENEDGNYCYHIPGINIESEGIDELNKRIYDTLIGVYEEKVIKDSEEYSMPSMSEMSYRWGYKDNAVSIIVQTLDNMAFYPFFYTYNVDAKTGKELSDTEVIKLFSLEEDEFYDKVYDAVKRYSDREKTKFPVDEQEGYLNGLIEKTLSDEYIRKAKPFIDSHGNLCVVVSLFSPGGADTYYHMLSLDTALDNGYIMCDGKHEKTEYKP